MSWDPELWDPELWASIGPEYKVELGLDAKPLDALSTVTWTDISEDVYAMQWGHGRSHERDAASAGTAAVLLDNESGDYDPMNAGGLHYPKLLPMNRIRISMVWEGVEYPKFTGYVDVYQLQRLDAHISYVEIKATDGSKLLNLLQLVEPYVGAVLDTDPWTYVRLLEDSQDPIVPLNDLSRPPRSGELYNPLVEVEGFNEGFQLVDANEFPGGKAMHFWDEAAGSASVGVREYSAWASLPAGAIAGTGPRTWAFVYERANYNTGFNGSVLGQAARSVWEDTGDNIVIQDQESGEETLEIRLTVRTNGSTVWSVTARVDHFDDDLNRIPARRGMGPYLIIVQRDGVDWEVHVKSLRFLSSFSAVTSFSGAFAAPSTFDFASGRLMIGTANAHEYFQGTFYTFPGKLAEIKTWDRILTSPEKNSFYAALHRWNLQASGDRVASVLNQIGWPAADRAIDPGVSVLQEFADAGASPLAHLENVARTEDGLFFFNGSGQATFYDRHRLLTEARSTLTQVTFGDAAGEMHYSAEGLEPVVDEEDIYNDIRCERVGGLSQRAVADELATSSYFTYGPRVLEETGLLSSTDAEMEARAVHKKELYAEPVPRVRSLTFSRDDDDDFFDTAATLQLWDRVLFRQRLDNETLWEQDSIVEGLQHSYDGRARRHRVTVALSSLGASLSNEDVWVLNVSALNVDTRLVY